jgi:hypothetical protein
MRCRWVGSMGCLAMLSVEQSDTLQRSSDRLAEPAKVNKDGTSFGLRALGCLCKHSRCTSKRSSDFAISDGKLTLFSNTCNCFGSELFPRSLRHVPGAFGKSQVYRLIMLQIYCTEVYDQLAVFRKHLQHQRTYLGPVAAIQLIWTPCLIATKHLLARELCHHPST